MTVKLFLWIEILKINNRNLKMKVGQNTSIINRRTNSSIEEETHSKNKFPISWFTFKKQETQIDAEENLIQPSNSLQSVRKFTLSHPIAIYSLTFCNGILYYIQSAGGFKTAQKILPLPNASLYLFDFWATCMTTKAFYHMLEKKPEFTLLCNPLNFFMLFSSVCGAVTNFTAGISAANTLSWPEDVGIYVVGLGLFSFRVLKVWSGIANFPQQIKNSIETLSNARQDALKASTTLLSILLVLGASLSATDSMYEGTSSLLSRAGLPDGDISNDIAYAISIIGFFGPLPFLYNWTKMGSEMFLCKDSPNIKTELLYLFSAVLLNSFLVLNLFAQTSSNNPKMFRKYVGPSADYVRIISNTLMVILTQLPSSVSMLKFGSTEFLNLINNVKNRMNINEGILEPLVSDASIEDTARLPPLPSLIGYDAALEGV